MTIAAMRRGLASCAGRLLRAATEGDVALGARQTTRAGLISAMGDCDRLCAAARVPALRTFTFSPTWALSDQTGRLRASQKAQLELEVKLLRQTVDALQQAAKAEQQAAANALRAADEAGQAAANALRAADEAGQAADAERQKAGAERRAAELAEQFLRTELALARGTLNMRGAIGACCWLLLPSAGQRGLVLLATAWVFVAGCLLLAWLQQPSPLSTPLPCFVVQLLHGAEDAEHNFRAALRRAAQKAAQTRPAKRAPQPQSAERLSRPDLWQRLLEQEAALAQCFEELGWARADAPKKIAELYKLLSRHVHNEFQLSPQRVDIVVSVTVRVPASQPGRGTMAGV